MACYQPKQCFLCFLVTRWPGTIPKMTYRRPCGSDFLRNLAGLGTLSPREWPAFPNTATCSHRWSAHARSGLPTYRTPSQRSSHSNGDRTTAPSTGIWTVPRYLNRRRAGWICFTATLGAPHVTLAGSKRTMVFTPSPCRKSDRAKPQGSRTITVMWAASA